MTGEYHRNEVLSKEGNGIVWDRFSQCTVPGHYDVLHRLLEIFHTYYFFLIF